MRTLGVIAGTLSLAGALIFVPAPAPARVPREPIEFTVYRNGEPIGFHRVSFEPVAEGLAVDIEIALDVKFGFITIYSYRHENRELWRDGRLVRFDSRTEDNGSVLSVAAAAEGSWLFVKGPKALEGPVPFAQPTSYWSREATVAAERLVDTQSGRLVEIDVVPMGDDSVATGTETIEAQRYHMTGDLEVDIWYDEAGRWVKPAFTLGGADFEYVLR
jgi:hypothetical protein